MCLNPFRNPGLRLANTFSYEAADDIFLQLLRPWSTDKYKEKTKSPQVNNRIREIKVDIREKLYLIQNFYCAFCGINLTIAREVHREHIAPQSQHGEYIFEPENLVLACYDCNDFKGKKRTVANDTHSYSTTTFNILHPYRDDYGAFIQAFYEAGGLFFQVISGVTDERAANTIKCLGLDDSILIKERGMRIYNSLIPSSEEDDDLIRATCSIIRRRI
jgi:uncharacterized protein (TIGR02646 family)